MSRPLLLDLFCGDGGAGEGYRRAGFDVIGVDLEEHGYPCGEFWQDNAVRVLAELYLDGQVHGRRPDVVHASPPCQAYSDLHHLSDTEHPDLVGIVRRLLDLWGGPYVIENVEGAPLVGPLRLCGSEFDLWADCSDGRRRQLRRHRLFESSVFLLGAGGCHHSGQPVGVYGTGGGGMMTRGYKGNLPESRQAMGTPWMSRDDVSQAIPPRYTEHIGGQLLAAIEQESAA